MRQIHAICRRHEREIEVARVAVVEELAVERHQRFRRIGPTQRDDGDRALGPAVRAREGRARKILQSFDRTVVAEPFEIGSRHRDRRERALNGRQPAIDGRLTDLAKFGRVEWFEADLNLRVVRAVDCDHERSVPARGDRKPVLSRRSAQREIPRGAACRGHVRRPVQLNLRAGDRRSGHGMHVAADKAADGKERHHLNLPCTIASFHNRA